MATSNSTPIYTNLTDATNGNATIATKQAWASLSATLSNQAYVLAFADAFVIIAAVLGV